MKTSITAVALLAGALALTACAAVSNQPQRETASGEIKVTGRLWCLSAPNLRDGYGVAVSRCDASSKSQIWLLSKAGSFVIISPQGDPSLCLGVQLRGGDNATLQDCATENAHGTLLRVRQLSRTEWQIFIAANGKKLSSPARLESIRRVYPAFWQKNSSGNVIQVWNLPAWRPVPEPTPRTAG